jgi:hypothetical protein
VTGTNVIGFSLSSAGNPGDTSMSGSAADSHSPYSATSASASSSVSASSSTSSAASSATSFSERSVKKRPVSTSLDFGSQSQTDQLRNASIQSKRRHAEQSTLTFTPTSSQLSPIRSIASEERERELHSIDRNISIDIEEHGSLGSTTPAAAPTPAPLSIREESHPPAAPPVPTLNRGSAGDTDIT